MESQQSTTSVELEAMAAAYSMQLDIGLPNSAFIIKEWKQNLDQAVNFVTVALKTYVYALRASNDYVVEYPKDWWQAFKKAHAPQWFLRRWPVENTKVSFHVRALLPDFKDIPFGAGKFKQVILLAQKNTLASDVDEFSTEYGAPCSYTPIGRMVAAPTEDELAELEFKLMDRANRGPLSCAEVVAILSIWTEKFFNPATDRS